MKFGSYDGVKKPKFYWMKTLRFLDKTPRKKELSLITVKGKCIFCIIRYRKWRDNDPKCPKAP